MTIEFTTGTRPDMLFKRTAIQGTNLYRFTINLIIAVSLTLAASSLITESLYAFESAFGLAIVEEGDDRTRPGARVHLGWNDFYYSNIFVYGMTYGPITERTTVASLSRRIGIFRSNGWTANYGLCAMNEAIEIDFSDSNEFDRDENNYNLGIALGFSWHLKTKHPLYMAASWDSHIFPAGIGGLFLSYGRKQMISFALGYKM